MGNSFKTLAEKGSASIVIKKSEFIGYAIPVISEEEAQCFIAEIKAKYRDARHNVFAYTVDGKDKYSDDGEPQGTAGVPMLSLIKKMGLTNVCVTVTRYFGGILLGAPGLVRAYSDACKSALLAAGVTNMVLCDRFSLCVPYAESSKMRKELQNFTGAIVIDTIYDAEVTFCGASLQEKTEELEMLCTDLTNARCSFKKTGEEIRRLDDFN